MSKENRDIRFIPTRKKYPKSREFEAILVAMEAGQSITYLAEDGCEVTAMPSGHIFYNATDWW